MNTVGSEGGTGDRLEGLLDLLSGERPDAGAALARVEEMLKAGPCADERRAADGAVMQLVDQLLKPALAGDPAKQVRLEELRAAIVDGDDGSERRVRALCREMSVWMRALAGESGVDDRPPQSLSGRLLDTLQRLAGGETAIRQAVDRWRAQRSERFPWEEVALLLKKIRTSGKKPAPADWQRQRRHLHETLIALADGWAAILTRAGIEEPAVRDLTARLRLRGRLADVRVLRQLLEQESALFVRSARSLQGRVAESREMAQRLKGRLDRLEAALGTARRERFLDPATGLPDRFAFSAHLKRQLERAEHLGESFSLVLFHFYEFQAALRNLGTAGENRLVTALTAEIRPFLPEPAYLARLSEERFVILFPKVGEERANRYAVAIGEMLLNTHFRVDHHRVELFPYYGAATFQPGLSAAQMLERTDRLTAAAKGWGNGKGGTGPAVPAGGPAPRLLDC